jgi:NAD(P)-dependent dehydrogenase (short-subunit alcohol dehydrogenase family)
MKSNQIIEKFLNKNYFRDKTVLITGANGVLGKELTEVFLKLESKLILIDKKIKKNSNKNIKIISLDFTNTEVLEKVLKKEKSKIKKLDFIINNAAYTGSNINWIKPLNFQTYKDWRNAHKVNLDSAFIISKILSKILIKNKGKIINIGSIFSDLVPNFSNYKGTKMNSPAAYSVSKNSLLHLTKWQASYFAPNVNVNMISPGGIFRNQNKKFQKKYINSTPLNRMCFEEDIIYLILFLLSDMSKYITGQNLFVDGGYSIL